MANEKVRFLSGPLTAITGNNPPAIQVGQLLFAVEQKGTNGPYYGSIYYDYAAGKRILMGQSLAFKGDTILNVTRNNTTGETEFSHTGRGLIFTVIGTQTVTTGAWTGTLNDLPNVSAMYDGLSILYYLPTAGSGNATLQLKFADGSESAAIPVYYTANSRCTTHYGAGSTIRLTYWTAGKKLGNSTTTDNRWTASEYNSDDIITQQETYTLVTAGTAGIMRYSLVMRDKDGKYQSLTTKTPTGSTSNALNDSARETNKVVNTTAEFVLGPVFYMNRSTELANNVVGGTSQVRTFCSLIDWRYTFNCGTTLTKNSPILIKGTINANGYFQLADTGYTQTWPTTDDGYVYILVGQTYSDNAGYRGDFWGGIATAYVYKNGGLRTYTGYANKAGNAVNAINAIKDDSGNTIDETYIASISGANNSGTTDYVITPVNGKGANQTALNVPINQISSAAKIDTKLFLIGATAQSAAAKPGYSHVNYYIGTDNKLHGTTFVGALEGNASSATSATSATKDSEGHQFTTTYLYKVSGAANGLNYKLTFETFNNQEAYVINVPQNKVGNKVTTSKMYLIGVNNTSTTDTVAVTNTDANATITNGVITALGFVGPLTGDVTGNVTGSAGSVAWANITDAPNQLVQGAAGTTATDKYTIQLYNISGAAIAANNTAAQNGVITIPAADTNKAGLITTAAQTIAGKKTFNGGIIAKTDNDFISHSNEFNFAPALTADMEIHINHRTAGTNTTDTKITRYHFKNGNGGYAIVKASSFEGNLAWSNLTNVPQIVEGALGENTGANYKIQLYNLAGAAIGTNASAATNGVINVPINLVSSESKINTKLYLVGVTSQSTSSQTGYSNDYFYIDTTNQLHGTFVGDVTGNLTGNADTATKATQDAAGNNIQSTYISNITISEHTLTFTNGQGGTTDRSLNYVQLSGDTVTGTINRYYTAANGSAMFTLRSNNQDATFVTMGHATSGTGTISNGYEIVYNGAGSAPNNLFKLVAIASASSKTVAMTVNEAGNVTFTNTVAANISGLAAKANQDNDGHVIHTTYLSTASGAANGLNYKLTFGRPNNASAIEINIPQNTVGNKKVTTKLYWVGVASTSTTDTVAATNTDEAIYATNGVLTATKFVGTLQGDVTGNVSGTAGSIAWSNITDKPQIVQGGAGTTATTNYTIQLYDVNGAAIAANNAAAQNGVITIPGATTSQAGLVTTGVQSFAGIKEFTDAQRLYGPTFFKKAHYDLLLGEFITIDRAKYAMTAAAVYEYERLPGSWANIYYFAPRYRYTHETAGDATSAVTATVLEQRSYFEFRQFSAKSADGSYIAYFEGYSLPSAALDLTENKYYKILTTKKTVTVAQGGTGVTTIANIQAGKDGSGQTIATTYIKDLSVSGTTLTITKGNGSTSTITLQDLDVKVNMKARGTTKAYVLGTTTSPTSSNQAVTSVAETGVYFDTTAGALVVTNLTATNLSGSLAWSNLTSVPQIVEGALLTKTGTTNVITLYDLSGAAISSSTAVTNGVITLGEADASNAGLMSNTTQTIAGAKTFSTSISTPTLTVTGSGGFNYSGMQTGTANADRIVWFSDSSAIGKPVYDNDFKYNPSTNTLKLENITASGAVTATSLSLSSGNDSAHSTEDATLKVTGGASISERLSAKMVRIDNGVTDTTKGFNLIYNSTEECLEFRFGN